ncbi:hypothetical protein ABK040_005810 [Willaertia magna]
MLGCCSRRKKDHVIIPEENSNKKLETTNSSVNNQNNKEIKDNGTEIEVELPFYKKPFYKKYIKPSILKLVDKGGAFNKIWFIMIFLIMIYNSFVIPFRAAFDSTPSNLWYLGDATFDFLLLLDIILNFFYPYRDEMNLLVTDFKKTARRYMFKKKLGLWVDLICLIPLDWLHPLVTPTFKYSTWWRINRALFFFKAFHTFTRFEDIIPDRFEQAKRFVKVARFMFMVIFVNHIAACLWFVVVMAEAPESQIFSQSASLFEDDTSNVYKYMLGLYWNLVSMSGYGGTMPVTDLQVVFTTAIYLIGIAVFVTVIGTVAKLAQNINVTESAFVEKFDAISDYLNYRNLPPDLQNRVKQYYRYLWKSRKGLDESKIISELPDFLKIDVAMQLNSEIVSKVALFKQCSKNFINEVIVNLKPKIAMPGSFIIRIGEIGNEMFFIGKGFVNIRLPNGFIPKTLGSGDFFGETALIDSIKRTADVIAVDYVDLFVLEKSAFDEIMSTYPEDATHIIETNNQRKQTNEQALKANQTPSSTNSSSSSLPLVPSESNSSFKSLLGSLRSRQSSNTLLNNIGYEIFNTESHELFTALAHGLSQETKQENKSDTIRNQIIEYIRLKDDSLRALIQTTITKDVEKYLDELSKNGKGGDIEITAACRLFKKTIVVIDSVNDQYLVFNTNGDKLQMKEISNFKSYVDTLVILQGKKGYECVSKKQ